MNQNFKAPAYHTSIDFFNILFDIKQHSLNWLDL